MRFKNSVNYIYIALGRCRGRRTSWQDRRSMSATHLSLVVTALCSRPRLKFVRWYLDTRTCTWTTLYVFFPFFRLVLPNKYLYSMIVYCCLLLLYFYYFIIRVFAKKIIQPIIPSNLKKAKFIRASLWLCLRWANRRNSVRGLHITSIIFEIHQIPKKTNNLVSK